jgi:hypothetical protein
MPDPRIDLLLRQLRQAFDERAWHGTNLLGSLRGLPPEVVAWRPQPGRHTIAELAVHAAYWKYRVHRKLSDAPPRAFDLPGSNFFPREGVPTADEWAADLALLKRWHERLLASVAELDPDRLDSPAGNRFTYADLAGGAAAHDLYHAGQIQLIKRLHQHRASPPPA